MIKSTLLKDKEGQYLTLTDCKEIAFRFENADIIATLVKVLQLNVEEIEETAEEVANAEIKNDW